MPSPFPGMDPYLESRRFWPDVHQALGYCLRAELNESLPTEFIAQLQERLVISAPETPSTRTIYADTTVLLSPTPTDRGGAAVLDQPQTRSLLADEPLILRDERLRTREPFIEIVAADTPERVVTVIEVLSPANKRPGGGREEYLRKQRDVLASDVHLLEIDLLRAGDDTLSVDRNTVLAASGGYDYLVCLHRADSVDFELWPSTVRNRLPIVRVPLTEGFADVPLDLGTAFSRVYDEGRFDRRVRYATAPEPPLGDEDAMWADALLRERGLRS